MFPKHHGWKSFAHTFVSAASYLRNRGNSGSYVHGSQTQMARFGRRMRRRVGSRTRTKRRRGGFRRRGSMRRRISKIWKFMRNKGIRNVETKYIQNTGTTTAGGANPNVDIIIGTLFENQTGSGATVKDIRAGTPRIWLTDIGNAAGQAARIGDKCFIRNVKFKGHLQANIDGSAANEVFVRFLVVRVKEAQSFNENAEFSTRAPNMKQIFEFIGDTNNIQDPTSMEGRSAFPQTWRWYNNRWANDFTVLKQFVVKVSKETGADYEKKLIKFNLRVNQPCRWDGGEPQDGHIYMYWYADQIMQNSSTVAGEVVRPVLRFSWRTTYTDV